MKYLVLCCCFLPLRHLSLSSGYGYRYHPLTGQVRFHAGIDLRARADTVFAVMPGRVDAVGYDPSTGVYITILRDDFKFLFGHLSQVFVLPGDSVTAGTPVAITGSTGKVTGEHLHFAVFFRGVSVNPLVFLSHLTNNLNKINKEKIK